MHDAQPGGATAPAPKPDFVFICDPGHAWLLVTDDDIAAVGLSEADFSPCSYRHGDRVALEEDVDAPAFIAAWEAAHGRRMTIAEHHLDHDAACRRWRRWGKADEATILANWSRLRAHSQPDAAGPA
jgi:hypothetical protein